MYKKLKRYAAAASLLGTLVSPLSAHAQDDKEYLIKATFIYKFAKFVEWPAERQIGRQSVVDICVVGSSPLMRAGAVFREASTAGLTLSLVEVNNWQNAASHCHMVFIGASEEARMPEILSSLKGKPVLTVSDIDGFVEKGGIIGFVMVDNKVKLTVNSKSAADAGLRIDAQLLEIALKVIDR